MLACLWSSVKYVGGYHGLLSGVTVRPGSVEPHSVVECLYACREGLDFGDLETLGSGMKVSLMDSLTKDIPIVKWTFQTKSDTTHYTLMSSLPLILSRSISSMKNMFQLSPDLKH